VVGILASDTGSDRRSVEIDAEEAEDRRIAPLDAAGQRLDRRIEARTRLLKLPGAVMVPVKALAKALAGLDMDQEAAAFVRGFGDRQEMVDGNAILLAEIAV
jgi:hypothetical protein